jgi:AcrR family transcriptional regulator
MPRNASSKRRGAKRKARAGLSPAIVHDAARTLADAEGLANLSLRRIAEHFEVKPPSLYNHIESLDALKRGLALEGARLLGERFARATAGIAKDAAVRALARTYREFAHAHPGLYQAALAAPNPGDREAEAAARATSEIVFAVLSGYALSGDALIHATRGLRAALHGFVALEQAHGFGLPVDLEASYERLIEMLLAGLRAAEAS